MKRPLAIDLFCGAGGVAVGLHRAGFDIVGVDINPQPRYPFEFRQADAMTYDVTGADFIWASPPCQRYTSLRHREDLSGYPDLVDDTRDKLSRASDQDGGDIPWVIENVPGSPVRVDITLCGAMFGLRSYRHRDFESNFPLSAPAHPEHVMRVNRRGENRRKHWAAGGFITVTGDVGTYCGPEAMGIDWMTGAEMSEAIPPAYSEYIGAQLIRYTRTYIRSGQAIRDFAKRLSA